MNDRHSENTLRAALACIPADDRELWVRMGMALKDECGEDGFTLFDEWSQRAANYSAKAAKATWKSCKAGGGVGIGTLIHEAQQRGFDLKAHAAPAPLSAEESARIQAERKLREAQEQKAKADRQVAAAQRAADIWAGASDTGESAYLARKGVQGHGVRYAEQCVLIAMYGVDGKLWNLQRIHADGKKLFLPGGRVSDCFHLVGSIDGAARLLIAEGYATGATLHEASGYPVAVAFNADNLRHVAEALRRQYPDLPIAVCADDDRQTEAETGKNPGVVAAKDAARRARAQLVKPEGLPDDGTDFNDLAAHAGIEEVRRQLAAAWAEQEAERAAAAAPMAGERDAGKGKGAARSENVPKATKTPRADRRPWFDASDAGVFFHGFTDAGDALPAQWICSPLRVTAQTRDEANGEWGFLLEMTDADDNAKQWAMPARMLSGDGNEYRSMLLAMGLKIAPGPRAKNLLTMYIQTEEVTARARCTDRIGWHGGAFVLPDRTIGDESERVLFQAGGNVVSQFKQRGTLEQWKEQVAALCVGNSRLAFCVSAAFAGTLLYHAGQQSGGFHLVGDSSSGKTTGLRVAASVFGGRDYARSWRATDNALELTAAQHSDALLILDELAQVDPKIIGDTVYMLANEAGKGRATRTATAKPALTWRLLFLSDGEIKLSDHMQEAGKTARAGQEIRLANVPADAGRSAGMFDDLHSFASGKALSDHLQDATRHYYGTAGLAFIEWAVENRAELPDMLRDEVAARVAEWVPDGAHGQVQRVAARFALVGVAGDLATHAGITGWETGEASSAARTCFNAWLAERGGAGNGEEQAMLQQVRQFFELHGAARFTWWHRLADDHAPVTMSRAGFRRMRAGNGAAIESTADHYAQFGDKVHPNDAEQMQCDWFVQPEVFRKEVCRGFNHKAVARLLAGRGALERSQSEQRPDKKFRVPSIGQMRLYHITPALFDAELQ
ncbi:DUF927 domain-containing protein [Ralstonia pickettii]|uniref:DUF927 domain-containing protein n=1 Tax=Ralstonia pickettii TaxID=329 RepID=UPI001BE3F22E|nr:DUF927 domain-containing protein [Ralstonia pickettii]MBT2180998.1 DUF927 domain-containing protein [Ralstonia pickettii]